jgi:hypothetical protein
MKRSKLKTILSRIVDEMEMRQWDKSEIDKLPIYDDLIVDGEELQLEIEVLDMEESVYNIGALVTDGSWLNGIFPVSSNFYVKITEHGESFSGISPLITTKLD